MRRVMLAACMLGCALHARAGDDPLTLARALRQATSGPAVDAATAMTEAAGSRWREVRAARLPHLEADAFGRALRDDPGLLLPAQTLGNPGPLALVSGERNTAGVGIGLQQLLFDAGRTGHALRATEAAEDSARADAQTQTRTIALATVRAFAGAVAAGRRLEVLRQALTATQETVRVVQAMVEQEVLPRSDLLAAEYRREELRAQLASAEAEEVTVRAGLAALVGEHAGTLAPLPPVPAEAAGLQATTAHLEERSELRALEQRREALLAAADAASADRLPAIVLVGRLDQVRDDYVLHRGNALAAVAVRVPVFDGGGAGARAAALRAEARALESAREAERRRIEGDGQARDAAEKAARRRLAATDQAVLAAAEALRLERVRHSEGLATTRDLLAALADDTAARASQATAHAGLVVAVAEQADAAGHDLVALFGEE